MFSPLTKSTHFFSFALQAINTGIHKQGLSAPPPPETTSERLLVTLGVRLAGTVRLVKGFLIDNPHFHRLLSVQTQVRLVSFYAVRVRAQHPPCPLHLGLVLRFHEGNVKAGEAELTRAFVVPHGHLRVVNATVGWCI